MSVGLERLWCTCEAIWGPEGRTVSPLASGSYRPTWAPNLTSTHICM